VFFAHIVFFSVKSFCINAYSALFRILVCAIFARNVPALIVNLRYFRLGWGVATPCFGAGHRGTLTHSFESRQTLNFPDGARRSPVFLSL
jgi:hypothetical protein